MPNCGRAYLSKSALENHQKRIHPEFYEGRPKLSHRHRCIGRYPPPKKNEDFESSKYDVFFNNYMRSPNEGETIDVLDTINRIFIFIYKGSYMDKLFSHPKNAEENPILQNLLTYVPISDKPKNSKSCDEVFYEYLKTFKDKTNEKYFALLIKFVLLFREFSLNKKKNSGKEGGEEGGEEGEEGRESRKLSPEDFPDLCNEFYEVFMTKNNFFDLDDNDGNEIVEIILHFCIWLFRNEYTTSKISLANEA